MPRPKKAGAPEPKRRSRNGCWPCKTRKVKCDEARPTCVNCQKQGEACDYSIRLNWEGRGKKKAETGSSFSQVNFSTNINDGVKEEARNPGASDSILASQMLEVSGIVDLQSVTNGDGTRYMPVSRGPRSHYPDPSDISVHETQLGASMPPIDPALMSPTGPATAMYQDTLYGGMTGQHQYTQSYERYRSPTPGTPTSMHHVSVSRYQQVYEEVRPPRIDSRTAVNNDISKERLNNSGDETGRPSKRPRYQNVRDSSPHESQMPPPSGPISVPTSANTVPPTFETQTSTANLSYPTQTSGTPLTPASSYSDESYRSHPSILSPHPPQGSPDLRRLSVNSLLSGPPGLPYQSDRTNTEWSNSEGQDWPIMLQDLFHDTTTYGVDRGIKDLDIGKNDDMNAISGASPIALRDHLELTIDDEQGFMPVEFGFGTGGNNTAFELGGYYEKPVPISIPRLLEPLPPKLLENPMNLLYFHHFLNHTAGALIPHNCSSNPFKLILPQMAVRDDNLLNLLLAYSASHRARLLRQPEPATRIALWVQGIFTHLRDALDDPSEIISNFNLATAIMLASLEIISPKAFGIAVPWQQHLDTARQMIAARGGPLRMKTASRGDKVASFLWSWFSYLDVLGSLSSGKTYSLSSTWVLDDEIDDEDDYAIDCILGFTSKCIRLLAKIAELARVCDGERAAFGESNQSKWRPSEDTIIRAEKLAFGLAESRQHPAKPCTHMQSSGEAAYHWDSLEMSATNEAFHWAGLVHLHRRILGKSSTNADVQNAVREIFGALYKVRKGSTAEACLLFPMFTAGCDSREEKQRAEILERIKSIERFGMTQIHTARTLMERVWETDRPWETLVAGEFFG